MPARRCPSVPPVGQPHDIPFPARQNGLFPPGEDDQAMN